MHAAPRGSALLLWQGLQQELLHVLRDRHPGYDPGPQVDGRCCDQALVQADRLEIIVQLGPPAAVECVTTEASLKAWASPPRSISSPFTAPRLPSSSIR